MGTTVGRRGILGSAMRCFPAVSNRAAFAAWQRAKASDNLQSQMKEHSVSLRAVVAACTALFVMATGVAADPPETPVEVPGSQPAAVASRPGIRIAADARSFERADGTPFFYLADTAWTAPTRPTLADMDEYLADRAGKGFTVIQTILMPWGAKWSGNVAGEKPFVDGDESRPNEAYWKHVDAWLGKIIARGMVPAVVPFWLRGRNDDKGPVPADAEAMAAYARFVGARYAEHEMI
jgi:hypothetical protein